MSSFWWRVWMLSSLLVTLSLVPSRAATVDPASASIVPLTLGTAPVRAELRRQLEYIADAGNALDFKAVTAAAPGLFHQADSDRVFNAGLSSTPHWFRFDVANRSGSQGRWLIEVAYPLLDYLDVYVPAGPGRWQHWSVGDQRPMSNRPIPDRNFVFPLNLVAGEQGTVFLRVQTESSLEMPITLWSVDTFHQANELEAMLLGMYYGIVLVMVLYNAFVWLSIRDQSFFEYILFVLFAGLLLPLALDGFGARFFWGQWPVWTNIATPLFICGLCYWGLRFTRSYLEVWQHDARLDACIRGILALSLIGMLLALILPYAYSIRIGVALAASSAILGALVSVRAALRRSRTGGFYLLAWGGFLASVLVKVLQATGVIPTVLLTTYSLQIGLVIEVVLLSLALADRLNTERRDRAEAQSQTLIAREEAIEHLSEYQRVFESVPEGLFQIDASRRVMRANPALASILGYPSVPELLNAVNDFSTQVIVHRQDFEKMRSTLRAHNQVLGVETLLRRRDGSTFWSTVTLRTRRDARGHAHSVDGMISDITERRERERLAQDRQRVEASTQAKSEFLAKMSHELRTPMNAIVGFTELALQPGNETRQRQYLGYIRSASQILLSLINDILDLSKIEAGKLQLSPRPFRPAGTIAKMQGLFAEQVRDSEITLRFQLSPEVPDILVGDDLRFSQILMNLLSNAIKFTERGSVSVSINASPLDADRVTLSCAVTDTGIGLSEAQSRALFQPFSQADGSITRRYGGTGLGLSICKQIVDIMGGDIQVVSELGRGSTFNFRIPMKRATAEECAIVEQVADEVGGVSSQGLPGSLVGKRVLLAEDNLLNQKLLNEMLSSLGIDAFIVSNGAEAVAVLSEQQFDLVLMDVQMPILDGYTATRQLRALPGAATIPVLAITANVLDRDIQQCYDAGMNDILTKPIDFQRLKLSLTRWLAQRTDGASIETPPMTRTHADVVLDVTEALDRLEGNQALYRNLLSLFLAHHSEDCQQIAKAIEAGHWHEAHRLTHTLKGVAGNLVLNRLYGLALALEKPLSTGTLPDAALWHQFDSAFAAAVLAVKQYLEPTQG